MDDTTDLQNQQNSGGTGIDPKDQPVIQLDDSDDIGSFGSGSSKFPYPRGVFSEPVFVKPDSLGVESTKAPEPGKNPETSKPETPVSPETFVSPEKAPSSEKAPVAEKPVESIESKDKVPDDGIKPTPPEVVDMRSHGKGIATVRRVSPKADDQTLKADYKEQEFITGVNKVHSII